MMWENGRECEPVEFLEDRSIVTDPIIALPTANRD